MSNYDYLLKILLVGNSGVGKSSISSRYACNTFTEDYMPTIGIDFNVKLIPFNDKHIKLHIWDSATQERFRPLTYSYFKGVHIILIIYDCGNRDSFNNISFWLDESSKYGNENAFIAIIGNKKDLYNAIPFQEGWDFAQSKNLMFFEVSCKNNEGIEEAFNTIINELWSAKSEGKSFSSIGIQKKLVKEHYDFLFKLLLVGDTETGKSCLLDRYANDKFSDNFIPTIGIDFRVKTVVLENLIIKLQIWDSAGLERFRTITSSYYQGINGIILVYDITNEKTYENLDNWLAQIVNYGIEDVSVILVGNKIDLKYRRVISSEIALAYADSRQLKLFETSSKNNCGIDEAFLGLVRELIRKSFSKDS